MNRSNPGLFHISEENGIERFDPRPSPSFFEAITGPVVFAISGGLLHNYLLPRDCPRVTYYAGAATTPEDRQKFLGGSRATHVIAIETGWYRRLKATVLYCYEFAADNFSCLDEVAGYYISYTPEIPVAMRRIDDIVGELLQRDVELRILPELWTLGNAVKESSLSFSLIRMRNAVPLS
jgi:hypothetical protein